MGDRAVDAAAELLSGGLDKLTGVCAVTGVPKANGDGLALVKQMVTSLFAPPPAVTTHIFTGVVAPTELSAPGIPGGSGDPLPMEDALVDPGVPGPDGGDGDAGEEGEEMVESPLTSRRARTMSPKSEKRPPAPAALVSTAVGAESPPVPTVLGVESPAEKIWEERNHSSDLTAFGMAEPCHSQRLAPSRARPSRSGSSVGRADSRVPPTGHKSSKWLLLQLRPDRHPHHQAQAQAALSRVNQARDVRCRHVIDWEQ